MWVITSGCSRGPFWIFDCILGDLLTVDLEINVLNKSLLQKKAIIHFVIIVNKRLKLVKTLATVIGRLRMKLHLKLHSMAIKRWLCYY